MKNLFQMPNGSTIDLDRVFYVSPVVHKVLENSYQVHLAFAEDSPDSEWYFVLACYAPLHSLDSSDEDGRKMRDARVMAATVHTRLLERWENVNPKKIFTP